MSHSTTVDVILERHRQGDPTALNKLIELLYPELKLIARQRRNQVKGFPTLTATSILNEAYLKIKRGKHSIWTSKNHFYSVMSLAMRHFMLTYMQKRSNTYFEYFDLAEDLGINACIDDLSSDKKHLLISIGQLMDQRIKTHPKEVEVVHCRVFLGLSVKETAEKLEIGEATVKRRWSSACKWMKTQLDIDTDL